MGILDELRAEGRVLLIATHDVEQARRWDRVLCLAGTQVAYGPPADDADERRPRGHLRRGDRDARLRPPRGRHPAPLALALTDDPMEILRSGLLQRALLEVVILGATCGALGVWLLHVRSTYAAESLAHAMLPGLVVAALVGRAAAARRRRRRARRRRADRARRARHARRRGGRRRRHGHDGVRAGRGARARARRARAARRAAVRRPARHEHGGPRRRRRRSACSSRSRSRPAIARWRLPSSIPSPRPSLGVRPGRVQLALLALLAVAVVAAVQGLGNLLVLALIVAPASAGIRLGANLRGQIAAAAALGALAGLLGPRRERRARHRGRRLRRARGDRALRARGGRCGRPHRRRRAAGARRWRRSAAEWAHRTRRTATARSTSCTISSRASRPCERAGPRRRSGPRSRAVNRAASARRERRCGPRRSQTDATAPSPARSPARCGRRRRTRGRPAASSAGGVLAALDVPLHARRARTGGGARDDAPGGALGRGPAGTQRAGLVAERVDQMQRRVGTERVQHDERRRALVDADLHDLLAPAGKRGQQPRLARRVHRPRRDQARADGHRAQTRIVADAIGREAPDDLRDSWPHHGGELSPVDRSLRRIPPWLMARMRDSSAIIGAARRLRARVCRVAFSAVAAAVSARRGTASLRAAGSWGVGGLAWRIDTRAKVCGSGGACA